MQSVFVIITKLIASKNYFCKDFFVIILAALVVLAILKGVHDPNIVRKERAFRRSACRKT